MTDLQLGLLLIGAAAVVGVLVYNRRQESSARRAAERAVPAPRSDVLLERGERREEPGRGVLADYVIELRLASSIQAKLEEHWRAVQQRFGRRAALSGADTAAPRAALQMVSRRGVVSEAELVEFRALVETLARAVGAALSAPEMRSSLEAARELDRFCADADIQVALHVVGVSASSPIARDQPFEIASRQDGLTLTLDVARSADPARGFEAMARAARQLAAGGGRIIDDNGRALDEPALAAIAAQLESARRALAERGIEPGSPLALRLFS
jgi:hypothetical protein